jgi:hypothetical protein
VRIIAIALALLFTSAGTIAQQVSAREDSLRYLEVAFRASTVFTAESPLLVDILSTAKSANPNVPEAEWQNLRPEFAASVSMSIKNDGGATLRWLRVAYAQLSDSELERVAQIYRDPVFVKAQISMSSAASQREAMQRTFVDSQLMVQGINAVLKSRGLIEIH